MRRLLLVALAVLFMAGIAFADGVPTGVDAKNQPAIWTKTVYNSYTSALTSGTVVIWNFDAATGDYADLLPYVTTTTSADSIKVAGVVISDSIEAGGVGEICVYGAVLTLIADSTDTVAEDELVGTCSVRGQAGAFATSTNNGYLGYVIHDRATNGDWTLMAVFVNPGYDD